MVQLFFELRDDVPVPKNFDLLTHLEMWLMDYFLDEDGTELSWKSYEGRAFLVVVRATSFPRTCLVDLPLKPWLTVRPIGLLLPPQDSDYVAISPNSPKNAPNFVCLFPRCMVEDPADYAWPVKPVRCLYMCDGCR